MEEEEVMERRVERMKGEEGGREDIGLVEAERIQEKRAGG